MNALLIAVFALAAPLVLGYDEKYDKLDVDKILELLPEVISTACAKCSAIQRQNVRKTVKALSEKKPDDFAQFRTKFDPKGEYEKAFSAFVIGTD
ncbi:hypothetical protein HF086_008950 [Spodoptera exigua]|uniref:Uncharacterized protein n=1 Tax=Spodoptera exigua TaxID=7107 RepID=A0A922MUF4_SPOEX|nr:hypothetical protein HF086_008950 [Spodoptera exigua]